MTFFTKNPYLNFFFFFFLGGGDYYESKFKIKYCFLAVGEVGGGEGKLVIFFHKESKSKKKNWGGGGGARWMDRRTGPNLFAPSTS